jgi:hypothetical protein
MGHILHSTRTWTELLDTSRTTTNANEETRSTCTANTLPSPPSFSLLESYPRRPALQRRLQAHIKACVPRPSLSCHSERIEIEKGTGTARERDKNLCAEMKRSLWPICGLLWHQSTRRSCKERTGFDHHVEAQASTLQATRGNSSPILKGSSGLPGDEHRDMEKKLTSFCLAGSQF